MTQTITAIFPKSKDFYLTIRNEDKSVSNIIYQNFTPYFYATNDDMGPIAKKDKLFKVEADHPGKIPELKEQFKHSYESNVPYDVRFLIDVGDKLIDSSVKWNISWIDIEAKIDGKHINEIKKGETEITAITKIDTLYNRLVCFTTANYNDHELKQDLQYTLNLAILKSMFNILDLENNANISLDKIKLNNANEIKAFVKEQYNLDSETIKKAFKSASELLKPILDLDIEIKRFDNENELLKAFSEDLIKYQPDIITGWNVHFDYNVIYHRMEKYKMLRQLCPEFKPQFYGDSFRPTPRIKEIEMIDGKTMYKYHTPGYYVLDYLEVYQKRRLKVEKSYTLDYITHEWDIEIPKFRHGYNNLDDLLANDPTLYVYYNIIDVISLFLLEHKTNYLDISINVSNFTKCPMTYCLSQRMLVDASLISWLNSRGLVRITKGQKQNINFEGAYVYANTGFHKGWIADADFTSLYPSIIRTCNISPETFVSTLEELKMDKDKAIETYIVCPNNACFMKKSNKKGILPTILDELFMNRKKAKKQSKEYLNKYKETNDIKYYELYKQYDNLQMTLKILLNSFYGVFGDAKYDLCTPEIAGAVTATGRFLIKYAKDKLEEKGFKVIYIDTDSNYIMLRNVNGKTLEEQICQCIEQIMEIYNYINSQWDELVKKEFGVDGEHYYEMKSELLAKNMIISKKKRYALALVLSEAQLDKLKALYPDKDKMIDYLKSIELTPHIEVKGLEVVRSDVSDIVVEEMQQMLADLLYERKTPSQLRRLLQDLFVKVRRLALSDINKIAIPVRLNSWIDKNGNPITNAKALAIKEYNEKHQDNPILLGEKCLMVYTTDPIGAKVWKKGTTPTIQPHEIDWKKMFKALLEKKVEVWYDLLNVKS